MRSEDDFDAFYTATSGRMVGQLFAMLGDLAEAEDAVQEAYARAWRRWPTLGGYDDPERWVRTVAYRIGVSAWRKAVNRSAAHRRHGRPQDVPGLSADRLALVAALRAINPDQRRALVLHYILGLCVEEIAAETGAPPNTVKTRLLRGRIALRVHLSESADDAAARPCRPRDVFFDA
jgi:RNA polymerase sigma-70 factor (ECF subfamily)